MAVPPSFLEELRRRLPLSGVVGRRVRLAKKGREFEGLCPFHNEKSPSFFVNDEKAFYHCFGCGAHGDMIAFVINTEGLSFPDAVERLAAEAGMEVPRETRPDPAARDHSQAMLAAVEAACVSFQEQLAAPGGRVAREYLTKRGLGAAEINRFRLGFAPDAKGALKTQLIRAGHSEEILIETGLLIRTEERPDSYDRFRGRVIFPIMDRRGKPIAFGGRILGDGKPKYLNSPDTPLFHKGRVLFAHHLAREAATKSGEVIVTEGYMDVVALHKAGFATAVAPLGTALTEEQIGELWRIAPEPLLCFDGDSAGQRAAMRAAARALPLLEPGKSLRFVSLPAGQDPDDVVRAPGGIALMRERLTQARPLVDLIWELELSEGPTDTPERRADLKKRLRDRLGQITDRDIRNFYAADFLERERALFGSPAVPDQPRRRAPFNPRIGQRQPFWRDPLDGYLKGRPQDMGKPEHWQRTMVAYPLLAAFLNHPTLGDDFLEQFAALSFGDESLDSLRLEIVNTLARQPGLEAVALQTYLAECGHTSVMTNILHRDVYRVFPFSGPNSDPAAVSASIAEVLGRMEQERAVAERKAAEILAVEEATPENWARFRAHFRDDGAAEDPPDDLPAGVGAGRPVVN